MTDTSRRNLLRAGIVGTFLATLVPAKHGAAATTTDLYSRLRFTRRMGATFKLSSGTQSWYVTLDAVADLSGAPSGAANAFRLTFRTNAAGPPQGTYTLRRTGFAATPLFVVPSDAARHNLHAVVNRTA